MKKGLFIVIDGVDAAGKATQTDLLSQHLEHLRVPFVAIDFPGYTRNFFGALIRECLDEKHGDFIHVDPYLASIPYALDRFETSAQIASCLRRGKVVIADRYVSANQIHQGGKITDPEERHRFLKWLDQMEYGFFKIPRPDIILYLDLPSRLNLKYIKARLQEAAAKSSDRRRTDRRRPDLAESNPEHLELSRQSALKLLTESNDWHRIDCTSSDGDSMKSREEIHELIWKKVEPLIAQRKKQRKK